MVAIERDTRPRRCAHVALGNSIVDPASYGTNGYPWSSWKLLRATCPVHWFEADGWDPFWVITKYADIVNITKDRNNFRNAPRPLICGEAHQDARETINKRDESAPDLLELDGEEHSRLRRIVSPGFRYESLRLIEPMIVARAHQVVEGLAELSVSHMIDGRAQDFVTDVANHIPITVMCHILSIPSEDIPNIQEWTNAWIAPTDQKYQRGRTLFDTLQHSSRSLHKYFASLIRNRRRRPGQDILSQMIGWTAGDAPLSDSELSSLSVLLLVAGNETTRNAMSGGMLALIEHPLQFDTLRNDPGLVELAAEEILRWTSPIIHFARTAVNDIHIHGQLVRKGETVALFYPSGNRDEDIFDGSSDFRISRQPNKHLAFGAGGPHHCLGAELARLEIRTLFRELSSRSLHISLKGSIERTQSAFVGGLNHLPIKVVAK